MQVLRSRGVHMNIPRMVRELHNEIPGGGISGGGHLVVGSIKFVEGMRSVVLEALIQKIGEASVPAVIFPHSFIGMKILEITAGNRSA